MVRNFTGRTSIRNDPRNDSVTLVEETVQVEEVVELNDRQVEILEAEEDVYY